MTKRKRPATVEIISQADADRLDPANTVIVCSRENYLADNCEGRCAKCGVAVFYRPDAPVGTHICLECCMATVDPRDARIVTTQKSIVGAALFAAETKGSH